MSTLNDIFDSIETYDQATLVYHRAPRYFQNGICRLTIIISEGMKMTTPMKNIDAFLGDRGYFDLQSLHQVAPTIDVDSDSD